MTTSEYLEDALRKSLFDPVVSMKRPSCQIGKAASFRIGFNVKSGAFDYWWIEEPLEVAGIIRKNFAAKRSKQHLTPIRPLLFAISRVFAAIARIKNDKNRFCSIGIAARRIP